MREALVLLLLSAASVLGAEPLGQSYTPIFGYDDKNGALFGAAAFLYREGARGFNAGLYGAGNFKDFGGEGNFSSLTFDWEGHGLEGWVTAAHAVADRSYDYFYGEGGSTSGDQRLRLSQGHESLRLELRRDFLPGLSVGPFLEGRFRQVAPGDPFGDESTPAAGLHLVDDHRDSRMNPSRGWYLSSAARFLKDGAQGEAEFRHFLPLGGRLVQAFRVLGGVSAGNPDYLYRFRLGGTDLLRGYQDNRFRGRAFYAVQEEWRIKVWRMVSFNVSADLGNASEGGLELPHLSSQVGLRLGIPPDWGMKARLELGWSPDNHSLAVQFGEVF